MADTSYIQSGNIFRFNDNSQNQIHDLLPASNFIVKMDMMGNFFLERIDAFPTVGKLYGSVKKNTARILNTFLDRPSSTGILLTGEKGSGKTLLAKNVIREAAHQYNIPTLVINQPIAGDGFNKFVQTINQPAIVLFDEFEKVYDAETQERMLTLLDGVFPSQKLFILTCNDKWRVNEHMRNRPGRIYYSITFDGLETAFIREYCEDNLKDKSHIDQIVTLSGFYSKFNFDMLKAIVEEMNRYGETPQDALELLNAKVEYSGKQAYDLKIYVDGKLAKPDMNEWVGNPIAGVVDVDYEKFDPVNPDDPDWVNVVFGPESLIAMDPVAETTTYQKDNARLVLTRKRPKGYDIFSSGVF